MEHKIQIETRILKQKLKVEKIKIIDHGYYLKQSSAHKLDKPHNLLYIRVTSFFFHQLVALRRTMVNSCDTFPLTLQYIHLCEIQNINEQLFVAQA